MSESNHVQGCSRKKLASICSDNVLQLWGLFLSCRTIRQVNQSVDGGPPDQDPVMAGPISRPEPHWKPLECDQEHERCDCKSGLFIQILIYELFSALFEVWKHLIFFVILTIFCTSNALNDYVFIWNVGEFLFAYRIKQNKNVFSSNIHTTKNSKNHKN